MFHRLRVLTVELRHRSGSVVCHRESGLKDHGCPSILLAPAIEIPVAIAAGAATGLSQVRSFVTLIAKGDEIFLCIVTEQTA
jgi:hypothetical protein